MTEDQLFANYTVPRVSMPPLFPWQRCLNVLFREEIISTEKVLYSLSTATRTLAKTRFVSLFVCLFVYSLVYLLAYRDDA